jgi:hypothetical protein
LRRILLGLALLVLVAGLTWFGHGGRLTFAVMTLLFVASAVAVLAHGFTHPAVTHGHAPITGPEGDPLFAVVLSFPVAMALATGTEAPSTAIAQLGQLGPDDRRRFARGTLALTLVIVAGLTIGLAGLAVCLHVAASGHEQELVLFYAVAVFVSFLAGLAAMARFSLRDRRTALAAINVAGAIAVAFTLVVNLARGYPLLSMAATAAIAATLYTLWARAGRPAGIEEVERHLDEGGQAAQ